MEPRLREPSPELLPRPSVREIAWVFFRIGALAFGETELVMIEREFVDRRKVLTHQDLTDALTYTKALPGSTVVQIVAYLSYKLGGWPGSALCTVVYLLPSTLAMVALAAGYLAVSTLPLVRPAAQGLTAAAVGLLLATAWRLGRRAIDPRQPLSVGLAVAAVVVGGVLGVNAALIVVIAGLIGIMACQFTAKLHRGFMAKVHHRWAWREPDAPCLVDDVSREIAK